MAGWLAGWLAVEVERSRNGTERGRRLGTWMRHDERVGNAHAI
jgi:hypothetical protein